MECRISKSRRVDDALLLRLPAHLISDILLRLPIESISCCKCVCKTLEKIPRDPTFAELHLTNASKADKRLIIQNERSPFPLYLFHVLDLDNILPLSPKSSWHRNCAPRFWKKVVIPPIISKSGRVRVSVVGSCNGLLCLAYSIKENQILYVCNPILGEFMFLPEPTPDAAARAFGFCPKTKQYKVVRFDNRLCSKEHEADRITFRSYCEIHTLGTIGWRSIANVYPPLCQTSPAAPAHLNGNLHWLADGIESSIVLYSFNLETEQVFDIPSPPQFSNRHIRERSRCFSVGVLGGLLCISYIVDRVQFGVFVLKNYGVKDSWTKQFDVDINFLSVWRTSSREVSWIQFLKKEKLIHVKFLESGNLLLKYLDFPLVFYNPRKEIFSKITELGDERRDAYGFSGTYDGGYYDPSLISL